MCVTNEPSNIFISKMITTLPELHMQYDLDENYYSLKSLSCKMWTVFIHYLNSGRQYTVRNNIATGLHTVLTKIDITQNLLRSFCKLITFGAESVFFRH